MSYGSVISLSSFACKDFQLNKLCLLTKIIAPQCYDMAAYFIVGNIYSGVLMFKTAKIAQ